MKKVAIMGANLNPGDQAVYPEVVAFAKTVLRGMPPAMKESPQGKRMLKVSRLLFEEPHISPEALAAISAPALVMAGDHDVIRDEHTVDIYHHLPNSQLCIFPNATHMIPIDDPALFNATVERFFRTPFVKKDRIKDMMNSMAAAEKALRQ